MLHKFLKIMNCTSGTGFTNTLSPQQGTSSSFSDIKIFNFSTITHFLSFSCSLELELILSKILMQFN